MMVSWFSSAPQTNSVFRWPIPWRSFAVALAVVGLVVGWVRSAQANDEGEAGQAWKLRCMNLAPSAANDHPTTPAVGLACEASQAVSVRQGDQDVEILKLAISSVGDEKGKPRWGLVALLPLDVLLTSDLGLGADKVTPGLHRYRNCNHLGCFAVVPLTDKLVAGLSRSQQGTAYFRLINGKVVKVVFSLAGFGDAFGKLSSGKDLPAPAAPAGQPASPEAVP